MYESHHFNGLSRNFLFLYLHSYLLHQLCVGNVQTTLSQRFSQIFPSRIKICFLQFFSQQVRNGPFLPSWFSWKLFVVCANKRILPGYPIFHWSMMVMVEYGPMQDKILKVQLLRVWRSCKSQLGDVIGKKPGDQAKDVRIFGGWKVVGWRTVKKNDWWVWIK